MCQSVDERSRRASQNLRASVRAGNPKGGGQRGRSPTDAERSTQAFPIADNRGPRRIAGLMLMLCVKASDRSDVSGQASVVTSSLHGGSVQVGSMVGREGQA